MPRRPKLAGKPLDPEALEALALAYVARFMTTRTKLLTYLQRKLRERGWADDSAPDLVALADRLVSIGYVDDAAYAEAKSTSLLRRGYGARRVDQTLMVAGIAEGERQRQRALHEDQRWSAGLAFAVKRRIGPFARDPADPQRRDKQIQAMVRAGHDFALAKALVFADSLDALDDLDADQKAEFARFARED